MKYLCSYGAVFGMLASFLGHNCEATTLAKDDQNLAQKIFETIENKGQAELCKEGGLLRGAAKKDGTIVKLLGTVGANCNRNETFARIALAACGGNADFDKSQCSINAKRILGGYKTPKILEDLKSAVKAGNQVVKKVVCEPFTSKLSGNLAQAAAACGAAPQRPGTAAPTLAGVPKQQVQAGIKKDLDWVDALLNEIQGLDATSAARSRKMTVSGKTVTLPPIDIKKKSAFVEELKRVKSNLRKVDQSVASGPDLVPHDKAEKMSEKTIYDSLADAKNDQDLMDALTDEEKELLGF